jgi:predicted metal-binding protein
LYRICLLLLIKEGKMTERSSTKDISKTLDLVKTCIEAGAFKAFLLTTDNIPFDVNLRSYCEQNICGNYGKNYACPPNVGKGEELIEKARSYKKALVFQTVTQIEDSFDFEGMKEAARKHSKVADTINKEIEKQFGNYLQLTAGECTVCDTCALTEDKPCRFPDKAISSLEAYCMNVSTLAERCQMKYINGQNTVTYFGAFLFN